MKNHNFTGVAIGCGHDNIPQDITRILEAYNVISNDIRQEISIGCIVSHEKDLCITLSPDDFVLNADITGVDAKNREFWKTLTEVLNGSKLSYVKDHTLEKILTPETAKYIKENILEDGGNLQVAVCSGEVNSYPEDSVY